MSILNDRVKTSADAKKIVALLKKLDIKLPSDVEADDLVGSTYGTYDEKKRAYVGGTEDSYVKAEAPGYGVEKFEMWFVPSFGWVIPTLLISSGSTRRRVRAGMASADRTYAATLHGRVVRVGLGPHVKAQIVVFVRKSRLAVLRRFLLARASGAEQANVVRDRISSRRAEGQVNRDKGLTSWRWSR